MALADLAGGAHPFVRVRRWHPDVDDRDVGLVAAHLEQQILGSARLAGDLEAGTLQQLSDPLPEEHRVVGDHDAYAIASHGRTVGLSGWRSHVARVSIEP